MSIPKTNKTLLGQQGGGIYNHSYAHTNNANHTQTYTNPNVYAVIAIIHAQAGSGEITYGWSQTSDGWRHYNAGQNGNNLTISLNNKALITLAGGSGSKAGATAGERSWRGTTKGWGNWNMNYANTKALAQNGKSAGMLLTIPPNASISFTYTYRNASGASNKGNHTISVIY
ncbi:hypothetical protein CQA49_08095 [Helicobacter sp. MIT 00-7814]|uniref:hypothetical protein n=1 Tax=unclassified Helicobacter TaxID=2593540 RepID=UPI000E1E8DC4|nr:MULTISPECIES: hypothetical protein [unclassified Helicobacter]RDU51887.1 hypothetical protein CQA37_09245 [Helicobacter sp. MIT 99-10781]RDU52566.1 hypothetical protein CQA49_08095 [Helicobacter sp. MIT 00-7814]